MENLLKQKCVQHDEEYLAIQIAQDKKDENKYFCSQCLIELITNKPLILISQAKKKIQDKKTQISKEMQAECQEKINQMSKIKTNLDELQDPFKSVFTQMMGEIEQFKSETYQKLSEIQANTPESETSDQDFNLLSDESSVLSKSEENEDLIKKQLLIQIQYSSFCEKLQEVYQKFLSISKLPNDCQDNTSKEDNSQAQKIIKQNCKVHNEQLRMLKLDNNNRVQKFVCIECIQESNGNLVTPSKYYQLYEDYQQQSEKTLKYFQQLKRKTAYKIITLLSKIRDMYVHQINLYIKQLENNQSSFKKIIEETLQFKGQNILQFEQEKQLKMLEPVYSKESPDHYYNIIDRQSKEDKNLQIKFEEIMQQLIKFEIQNQHQIHLENIEHEVLLKNLTNKNIVQPVNQDKNDINLNSQDEVGIYNLENETNNFLSKKMTMYLQYDYLLSKSENSKYQMLQNEQTQLIQKLTNEQNKYTGELNKLQTQQFNSEEEKKIFQIYVEKKKLRLEKLSTDIKSNKLQIPNELQTYQKLVQFIDNLIRSEVNQIKQNNPYVPQYHSSYKHSYITYVSSNLSRCNTSEYSYLLAVMQPPLPNDTVSKFIVKINNSSSYAGVGICYLQTVQGYSYTMSSYYSSTGHYAYILCSNGYLISSKQGYINTQFTFSNNWVLICEYDPKNLKFNVESLNDGKRYQVDLVQHNLQMSPCVMLDSYAEIEIL